jgi:hypothetical protein
MDTRHLPVKARLKNSFIDPTTKSLQIDGRRAAIRAIASSECCLRASGGSGIWGCQLPPEDVPWVVAPIMMKRALIVAFRLAIPTCFGQTQTARVRRYYIAADAVD